MRQRWTKKKLKVSTFSPSHTATQASRVYKSKKKTSKEQARAERQEMEVMARQHNEEKQRKEQEARDKRRDELLARQQKEDDRRADEADAIRQRRAAEYKAAAKRCTVVYRSTYAALREEAVGEAGVSRVLELLRDTERVAPEAVAEAAPIPLSAEIARDALEAATQRDGVRGYWEGPAFVSPSETRCDAVNDVLRAGAVPLSRLEELLDIPGL